MGHASILVRDEIKKELDFIKNSGESYNSVIERIIKEYKQVIQNEKNDK